MDLWAACGAVRGASVRGPSGAGAALARARKREVVLRLMRGEPSELLARERGVPLYRLERWRDRAQAAIDAALKDRAADAESVELAAAMQRIGEQCLDRRVDALPGVGKAWRALADAARRGHRA